MKYNEIIDKIKEFELDVRFEKIEEFKHSEWFDISKKEIPIMEKFLSQLMNADKSVSSPQKITITYLSR